MARSSRLGPIRPKRVFYAAGPGNAIEAHKNWKNKTNDPTEVSITFSSQIEQYASDAKAKLYIVSHPPETAFLEDGDITIEHLPKPNPNSRGIAFHLRELAYGVMLLKRARSFKAEVAILDSGCTHYFWQVIFAMAGIKVVPVMHNTLWPNGYRPTGIVARAIMMLNRLFWRSIPIATLCVSPACARQVEELAGSKCRPLIQIRAQFTPDHFSQIPPAPPHDKRPFQIMFVGRATEEKGVFDIVEMARQIEERAPGRIRWVICGTGSALDKTRAQISKLNLGDVVTARGWTSPADQIDIYTNSHCAIVPTRSSFIEGLAMTAAEAALAGRPLISNPVVPALELLQPAAISARTDDPASYVEQIFKLIDDPKSYQTMIDACPKVSAQFLDRRYGLTHVLNQLFHQDDPVFLK